MLSWNAVSHHLSRISIRGLILCKSNNESMKQINRATTIMMIYYSVSDMIVNALSELNNLILTNIPCDKFCYYPCFPQDAEEVQ